MSLLELAFIAFISLVLGLGGAVSLYVVARAYYGGRSTFRKARGT